MMAMSDGDAEGHISLHACSKDLCLPCLEVEPPLSASLLKEWGNDIDLKLSSEEMEALQKELELGSADVFRDLNI